MLGSLWVAEMAWAEYNAVGSLADGRNEGYRWVSLGFYIAVFVLTTGTLDAVLHQIVQSIRAERSDASQKDQAG